MKSLKLRPHNKKAYDKVKKTYETEKIAAVVHATGTGKSYIALSLVMDNKNKKFIYITPSLAIKEHLEQVLKTNNYSLTEDLPNLEIKTYSALYNDYKNNLLDKLDVDYIILDEFHHIGADKWENAINHLISIKPKMKIFGMSATTVRNRKTAKERDMTLEYGDEIFSDKVVSKFTLSDAIIQGVLKEPVYKTVEYTNFNVIEDLEQRIIKAKNIENKPQYMDLLSEVKKKLLSQKSIKDLLKENLELGKKYIFFCPPNINSNSKDFKQIKDEVINILKDTINETEVEIYTTSSLDKDSGKKARDLFSKDLDSNGNDVKNKLRILFAINQCNEGVHFENIAGVILGRSTSSDIVFKQQIGRALSIGNKVEKPLILDLVNNSKIMLELHDELKFKCKKSKKNIAANIEEKSIGIEVDVLNSEIVELYKYLNEINNLSIEEKLKQIVSLKSFPVIKRSDKFSNNSSMRIFIEGSKNEILKFINTEDGYLFYAQIMRLPLYKFKANLSFEDKMEEYFENQLYIKYAYDKRLTFSDGVVVKSFINVNKERIKSYIKGKGSKYSEVFKTIAYFKNKLSELEKLEIILSLSKKPNENGKDLFSDGTQMHSFIRRFEKKLDNFLETEEGFKYKEQILKSVCFKKELTFIEKMEELLNIGYTPEKKGKVFFSSGTDVYNFVKYSKENILKFINDEENKEKYQILIDDKYLNQEKYSLDKYIDELIEMLKENNFDEDTKLSSGTVVKHFLKNTKYDIYKKIRNQEKSEILLNIPTLKKLHEITEQKEYLFSMVGLSYMKLYEDLKNVSLEILKAKITYLIRNDIEVFKDNQLNEIFYLNADEISGKYNLDISSVEKIVKKV